MINPATGQACWLGRHATKQDVDAAIQAARSATESCADMPIEKRIEVLLAVDDFNSAIDDANNTVYGLSAALLSYKKLTPCIDL